MSSSETSNLTLGQAARDRPRRGSCRRLVTVVAATSGTALIRKARPMASEMNGSRMLHSICLRRAAASTPILRDIQNR